MQAQIEKRIRNLFKANYRGETSELRQGLISQYAIERKDAIERTIHAMTIGKDVSGLFPDILKNLATHDLDQKKLVYLYLMNYAKTHPELVILAVNTFVQDTEDPNPLVRALAVRTMGCIRVDKMIDFLPLPLEKTLKDENPYVRKTAAITVAKLFDLDPAMARERGFIEKLKELLDDSNPMVIANAVSALEEIQRLDPSTKAFEVTQQTLEKLLGALNECTEWGRIAILTAVSEYYTDSAEEADQICDRVVPQLQHANPSVVLMAIRVLVLHMHALPAERQNLLKRKMSSPLVTLLATPPELQYVALRNIRIILQKFPGILRNEVKVFYCKHNDPLYLKLEKIEILVNLVSEANAKHVIAELKEYCIEVDMIFVRRAVKALGQVAVKVESSSEMVVDTLLDLLDHKIPYVTQEVAIVMRDILRKYPVFEDAIPKICDSIEEVDEPESRAAIVWILGEYADRIPPVKSLITPFFTSFIEESTQVQLQILTSCVKLYIKRPDDGKDIIHDLLQKATQTSDNADVRDRAYIYWRILSSNGELAKKIVLAYRPQIKSTIGQLPSQLLEDLLPALSTLAAVYFQSPAAMSDGGDGKYGSDSVHRKALEEQKRLAHEDEILRADNLLDLDDGSDGANDGSSATGPLTDNILSEIFMTGPQSVSTSSENATSFGAKGENRSSNFSSIGLSSSATQDILSLFAPRPQTDTSDNSTANASSSNILHSLGSTQSKTDLGASNLKNDDLLGLF